MKKIIIFLLFPMLAYAQRAEQVYRTEYSRIGLIFGPKILFTSNPDPNPYYEWVNSPAFCAGLSYSFFQTKDWNFRIAATFSTFSYWDKLYMPGYDDGGITSSGPYSMIDVPFEAQYVFAKVGKKYFSINGGLEFSYNPLDKGECARGGSGWSTKSDSVGVNYTEYASDTRLGVGLNLSITAWFAMKSLMIQLTPKYHLHFEKYLYKGLATTEYNTQVLSSTHYLTGDYFGLEISITPQKLFVK